MSRTIIFLSLLTALCAGLLIYSRNCAWPPEPGPAVTCYGYAASNHSGMMVVMRHNGGCRENCIRIATPSALLNSPLEWDCYGVDNTTLAPIQ